MAFGHVHWLLSCCLAKRESLKLGEEARDKIVEKMSNFCQKFKKLERCNVVTESKRIKLASSAPLFLKKVEKILMLNVFNGRQLNVEALVVVNKCQLIS